MELREFIKQYRKEYNLTMQEFAERCRLSKGYISMLESGKHPGSDRPIVPSIETYGKLAKGMGMSLDTLLRSIDGDAGIKVGEFTLHKIADASDLTFRAELDEDPLPQVTMIGRAAEKMTPEKREQMIQLLKVAFPDEFNED